MPRHGDALTEVPSLVGGMLASVGSAKNWDFGAAGAMWNGAFGGASGFTNTPQGKVPTASFMALYKQLVKVVRLCQAQSLEGGLGNGGMLRTK